MEKVYIVGAGGHTRSLINLLELNSYLIQGIYDDNFKEDEEISGYKLLGRLSDIKQGVRLVLSLTDSQKRESLYKIYHKRLLKKNLIHPKAIIEKRVEVGKDNQIFADVYINSCVAIGKNNILNTRCLIEHEAIIGDHNHIAIGSLLCGRVNIGNCCFIGAGAVVIDKVRICDNVIIGANSVVIRDITNPGTYVGNPVRKIK